MDTLPMRLVPSTSKLLSHAALSTPRFSPGNTRVLGRCGAADYTQHDEVLGRLRSMLEHPEAETLYALRSSAPTFRSMLTAVERFPVALGARVPQLQRDRYADNKDWVVQNLLQRSESLGVVAGASSTAHDLASMGESLTEVQALGIVASLRSQHEAVAGRLLAAARGGDGPTTTTKGKRTAVVLGQSMLEMLGPLEGLLKTQPQGARRRLLRDHVDVPHTVRTIAESLCTIQAQGTRSTDLALCFLLTLLAEGEGGATGGGGWWELISNDRWEQLFKNLSLTPAANKSGLVHDHGAARDDSTNAGADDGPTTTQEGGDGSEGGEGSTSPFASAFEASIVCPAMLAVLSPRAPDIVKKTLLPVIQRDLMTLLTHLHGTSATLAICAEFIKPDDNMSVAHRHSLQGELIRLLDAEYLRRAALDEADIAAAANVSPPATHHRQGTSSLSLSMPKLRLPHPEGYLLLRSYLQKSSTAGFDDGAPMLALKHIASSSSPITRCAAGSDLSFMTANVAVAVQTLTFAGRRLPIVSYVEHLMRARDERRLDCVLNARSVTMLLTHPDMFVVMCGADSKEENQHRNDCLHTTNIGEYRLLLDDIKACVVSQLGPQTCAGFTAEQLQWIVSAQTTTAARSPLTAEQLRVVRETEGLLPVRVPVFASLF